MSIPALMPMADIARALRGGDVNWPLLGAGLWGCVHCLGDGTVLKLARREAGIGDGAEKLKRDIAVTHALNLAGLDDPAIPRPLAHGSLPEGSPLLADGLELWLRQTRLAGQRLTSSEIAAMPGDRQQRLAHSIGAGLARLQAALGGLEPGVIPQADPFAACLQLARGPKDWTGKLNRLITLTRRIKPAPLAHGTGARIHGDFNLDNLLFDAEHRLAGIVDFAEAGDGAPEQDLAKIGRDLPALADAIYQGWAEQAGRAPDPQALKLAEAHGLMISAMIRDLRQGDAEAAAPLKQRLDELLDQLETQP